MDPLTALSLASSVLQFYSAALASIVFLVVNYGLISGFGLFYFGDVVVWKTVRSVLESSNDAAAVLRLNTMVQSESNMMATSVSSPYLIIEARAFLMTIF